MNSIFKAFKFYPQIKCIFFVFAGISIFFMLVHQILLSPYHCTIFKTKVSVDTLGAILPHRPHPLPPFDTLSLTKEKKESSAWGVKSFFCSYETWTHLRDTRVKESYKPWKPTFAETDSMGTCCFVPGVNWARSLFLQLSFWRLNIYFHFLCSQTGRRVAVQIFTVDWFICENERKESWL